MRQGKSIVINGVFYLCMRLDKLAKFSGGKMAKAGNAHCDSTECLPRKNVVWCAESHELENETRARHKGDNLTLCISGLVLQKKIPPIYRVAGCFAEIKRAQGISVCITTNVNMFGISIIHCTSLTLIPLNHLRLRELNLMICYNYRSVIYREANRERERKSACYKQYKLKYIAAHIAKISSAKYDIRVYFSDMYILLFASLGDTQFLSSCETRRNIFLRFFYISIR